MVDVNLKAEAELAAVRVCTADSTPSLVSALAAAGGISCAPKRVQPF